MTYPEIALAVYVAGILPAAVFGGWDKERSRDPMPVAVYALIWPVFLLFIPIGIVCAVGWLFEQPGKLGAQLFRRYGAK